MARWTRLYDELAGPRYPTLLAYAELLTGDRETADALVASALKRTFARPRRLDGIGPAESLVRHAIGTRFLARASEFEARAPETGNGRREHDGAPESTPDAPRESQPADHDHPNPYAPPAPGQEPTSPPPRSPAKQDGGVGDGADPPARASAGVREPHGTVPRRQDEESLLRETLLLLQPQARVVALLRHHDGLTPGQITERLDLSLDTVRSSLQDVRRVARTRLDIDIEDEPHAAEGHSGSEVTVSDHAGRV